MNTLFLLLTAAQFVQAAAGDPQAACFECHEEVRELKTSGKHKGLSCAVCHPDADKHLADVVTLPKTAVGPEVCGKCHKEQFQSFGTLNLKKTARLEKSLPMERSPNPLWDKLMMGHGFTKEHNSPRSHANMLVDHLAVDRAYGGRFQPKEGWKYTVKKGAHKAWDVLEDKQPQTDEHKPFLRETAAAANPTCFQCKTQDHILRWKYLGEKDPAAKWDRTSNVVQLARTLEHGMNCFYCHDPHAAKPRIVRDGLIAALTRDEKDTLWHKDPKATPIEVKEFRGGFRKVALLAKYDTKLQCGQCHVEYNCNPGTSHADGSKIGLSDVRTNHFPFKDVFQMFEHYNKNLQFGDFKHQLTGALLWKGQHPEVEAFWNSKHDKAGVSCNDCHMPKMKGKDGKVFTSHWQTSPKNYLKETCLKCHKEWGEGEALYAIDSLKNHVRGKMRKSEFWLSELIDKVVEGRKAGLSDEALKPALEQHQKAHIYWEWWTAENSDGFHNPDAARESLTRSIEESKKGIKLLDEALAAKKP